jgi:hypothetical protein
MVSRKSARFAPTILMLEKLVSLAISAGSEAVTIDLDTLGLASLKLRSYGRYGIGTQPAPSVDFTPQPGGEISGGIGVFSVERDVVGVIVDVAGNIGRVKIGGSLIGEDG